MLPREEDDLFSYRTGSQAKFVRLKTKKYATKTEKHTHPKRILARAFSATIIYESTKIHNVCRIA